MDVLYCLAAKNDDNEYEEHSVYLKFESALVTIYDLALKRFQEIMVNMGIKEAEKYKEDLKNINSIRSDYKPDKVTHLFDKRFRITKVKNYLTNKIAITNILEHINTRFLQLRQLHTNKQICFPLEILTERVKNSWYKIDEFNAGETIRYLEKHIQGKIDDLKFSNFKVVQGILERNNDDFISVRFTDSQSFMLNREIFSIVVSPETGFNKSLTSS
jgi:hypothetical protein